MTVRIDFDGANLVVRSPYNRSFVDALKWEVPASMRKWDNTEKVWLVLPTQGKKIVSLVAQYYGEMVDLPAMTRRKTVTEQKVLDVRYIGTTKDRDGGKERTALGWMNGEWCIVFPENVLREWFNNETRPGEETTLFGVLGIKEDADADDVKTAYRRMAKQWHPDVCKEQDAAEQFKKINEAYQILSDGIKRAKYVAGLKLQASIGTGPRDWLGRPQQPQNGYRSPLRCGLILATGTDRLGRFNVEKIELWTDITDRRGKVLVTSWPMGADKPVETWA